MDEVQNKMTINGLNNYKSLRIYTKRILAKFENGLIMDKLKVTSTEVNTILNGLKFISNCIEKDQTEKIDLLEEQILIMKERLKNYESNR